MSNNTNGISTEMASQLGEVARLLTSGGDSLLDAACVLEDIRHGLNKANVKPREQDYLDEHRDSWLDDKNYLTVLEVAELAKYLVPAKVAERISMPKLQKLLYKVSVADGCPIALRDDEEPAYHKDIAVKCLKKIKAKAAGLPSVLEGEGDC